MKIMQLELMENEGIFKKKYKYAKDTLWWSTRKDK
jgi:hypothetical protein